MQSPPSLETAFQSHLARRETRRSALRKLGLGALGVGGLGLISRRAAARATRTTDASPRAGSREWNGPPPGWSA
ncbi:MAG TPA: hypothetical protein VHV47_09445 [Opitutaceae bacterium]|jgi:hypothetical protein|nr:hypothetical protein [Opitutaceae bacterium]